MTKTSVILPEGVSLQRVAQVLHQEQVPYLLVGGIAMLTHVEGRNTKDVGLLMAADAIKKLRTSAAQCTARANRLRSKTGYGTSFK
ncbi:MAG TPA: hypothetical protein VNZ64_02255 [Candidatus Acidoferrum sp.]|nr:hypothetical protein [Candidatus Acidoferrum sp.]